MSTVESGRLLFASGGAEQFMVFGSGIRTDEMCAAFSFCNDKVAH